MTLYPPQKTFNFRAFWLLEFWVMDCIPLPAHLPIQDAEKVELLKKMEKGMPVKFV